MALTCLGSFRQQTNEPFLTIGSERIVRWEWGFFALPEAKVWRQRDFGSTTLVNTLGNGLFAKWFAIRCLRFVFGFFGSCFRESFSEKFVVQLNFSQTVFMGISKTGI